jgi:hypothetical protein
MAPLLRSRSRFAPLALANPSRVSGADRQHRQGRRHGMGTKSTSRQGSSASQCAVRCSIARQRSMPASIPLLHGWIRPSRPQGQHRLTRCQPTRREDGGRAAVRVPTLPQHQDPTRSRSRSSGLEAAARAPSRPAVTAVRRRSSRHPRRGDSPHTPDRSSVGIGSLILLGSGLFPSARV